MPIDFDASRDAASANVPLQRIFSAPLDRAAQQLIDLGAVSDVRILQEGRVVTGIAGNRQRVYVQFQRADAPTIEGECSCGDPSPCVHVAAVVMTAAKISGAQVSRRTGMDFGTGTDPSAGPPEGALQRGVPLRQSLCYLIEPDAAGGLQLSAWVTQTLAGSGHIQSDARPFALRIPDGSKDYPRYVDARDGGFSTRSRRGSFSGI